MSKPTKYYRVEVAQTVEAYASVTVQARSAKEAERIVKGFIKRDGYVNALFTPEWDTSENLRIVEGLAEEADPAITLVH